MVLVQDTEVLDGSAYRTVYGSKLAEMYCFRMLLYLLVLPTVSGTLLSEETLARRSLTRFQKNHSDHTACWER